MSKYVELLLTFRHEIHESAKGDSNFFDVDLYDDLITLEQAIEKLFNEGRISSYELMVINLISTSKSFRTLEKEYKISRVTLSKDFKNICDKLAFYLGGYFTDLGYIKKLKQKYNLSSSSVSKLIEKFME
jgi:hypothetical protein